CRRRWRGGLATSWSTIGSSFMPCRSTIKLRGDTPSPHDPIHHMGERSQAAITRRYRKQLPDMNEQSQFPAGTVFGAIGQPIRRKEDARLLTGKGRYTDDFSLERQTFAAMVRSPHPHARIVRIDTSKAKAMPGVLLVLTGEDCIADALTPIPHSPVPSTHFDMKLTAPGGKPVFPG